MSTERNGITIFRFIVFVLSVLSCQSQEGNSKIQIEVTGNMKDVPYGEPSIAVNPNNSSEVIVAAMKSTQVSINSPFSYNISLFVTSSGGRKWKNLILPKVKNEIGSGDPWIVWGENGKIYLTYMAYTQNVKKKSVRIFVAYSNDFGETWSSPLEIFTDSKNKDHPVITYRNSNKNPVTVFVSGGFGSESVQIVTFDKNLLNSKTFVHGTGNESNNNLGDGISAGDEVFAFIQTKNLSNLEGIVTEDFGKTFVKSTITKKCIPYGFPMMASDNSGKTFNNRLYSVWSEKGDIGTQIFISYSDNKGKYWSKKQQISSNIETFNLMPQIEINRNGHILVVWTSPESEEKLDCYSMNYAISTDGSKIFNQSQLTQKKYCSNTSKNGAVVNKWKIGGDYFGIDSDFDGRFHVTWADSRTNVYKLWYAQL